MIRYKKSHLKKSPVNTSIDLKSEPSFEKLKWIRAWFSCLDHEYHSATKKLIEDAFVYRMSSRSSVFKDAFIKEIRCASLMFRLSIDMRDVETGESVCCPRKKYVQQHWDSHKIRPINKPVHIEITLPENHILKTIYFPGHVISRCLCSSVLTKVDKKHMKRLYRLYIHGLYDKHNNTDRAHVDRLYGILIHGSPLRIKGGLRISKVKGCLNKLMLVYESALLIQNFPKTVNARIEERNLAQSVANKLRMEPDNLFDPEFSTVRKKMLRIDDSLFKL